MSTATSSSPTPSSQPATVPAGTGKELLFDLSQIDLTTRPLDRKQIESVIPHRGDMALLDWIVWHSDNFQNGVALKHIREDDFWVPGHFPDKPMFPGVLMIESGAQLAAYLFNMRQMPAPKLAAFTRIENAAFRASAVPGDDLYLLCREFKYNTRRFVSDIQGVVGDKICFEARITGVAL